MQPSANQRFHALDAVRAGALLLGIAVHASMSFWPIPFWPIVDVHTSQGILNFFGVSHIFRMSLFFVIAGFFAHMMLHKRGVGGFVRDRLKRIGLPLVVFWPPLFAAFIALVVMAIMQANGGQMPEGGQQPALTWRTVPLLHTWFLYMLLWLYAGALAVYGVSRAIDGNGYIGRALDACIRVLTRTHLLPFVLAAPLAAVFALHGTWTASGGIRTPDVGLLPNIPAMVGFGTAFGFGWLLHRQTDLLAVWRRWWPIYLAAAAGLSVAVVQIGQSGALGQTLAQRGEFGALITASVYPLAIWAWCFGLIGLALRVLTRENKVVRYLADSSYWLYLIHLPVVMVGQMLVRQWDMSAWIKFPLITGISIALMLVSYQLLVRNTPLGGWLNGRRYGRTMPAGAPAAATAAE